MSDHQLSLFDLWYFQQFGASGSADHRQGALAAWSHLVLALGGVVDSCQPAQYSGEHEDVVYAKADIAVQITSLVGAADA